MYGAFGLFLIVNNLRIKCGKVMTILIKRFKDFNAIFNATPKKSYKKI